MDNFSKDFNPLLFTFSQEIDFFSQGMKVEGDNSPAADWQIASEIYGGSKRARLVMLVKQLAATPGVQEKVIDALLKNVEVFLEVPTKEED